MALTTLILLKHTFGGMYGWCEQLKILWATPPIGDNCFKFFAIKVSDKPSEKLYITLVIFDLFVEITFCAKCYVETLLFKIEDYLAGDSSLLNPAGNVGVEPASQLNELSHPI